MFSLVTPVILTIGRGRAGGAQPVMLIEAREKSEKV
jgi:hypothetical protein